jgi:hypothetical protein
LTSLPIMMRDAMVLWIRRRTEGHFLRASIGIVVKARVPIIQVAKWANMSQGRQKLRDAGFDWDSVK